MQYRDPEGTRYRDREGMPDRYRDENREYENKYRARGSNRDWEQVGPFTGMGPRSYQRSDERIFEDVCERLTRHGRIDARQIQVEVKQGEVFLEGSVSDRKVKHMVEDVAEQVNGVRDVHNHLRVTGRESGMPGGGSGRVDRVGGSGVYPASGPMPQRDAEVHGMASWGQGERGAAGYDDSGESELHIPKEGQQQDDQTTNSL